MVAPPGSTVTSRDRPGLIVDGGEVLGFYVDVGSARMLLVHDTWSGMREDSPLVTTYELWRDSGRALTGTVRHSSGGRSRYSCEIALGRATTTRLLRMLQAAPLAPGPYQPFIDHTDDFPRVEIVLVLEQGPVTVLLTSSSQGEFHAPWSVALNGNASTSPGSEIGRALAMLRRAANPARRRRVAVNRT